MGEETYEYVEQVFLYNYKYINIYTSGGQLAARVIVVCGSRLIKKKQYLLISNKIQQNYKNYKIYF